MWFKIFPWFIESGSLQNIQWLSLQLSPPDLHPPPRLYEARREEVEETSFPRWEFKSQIRIVRCSSVDETPGEKIKDSFSDLEKNCGKGGLELLRDYPWYIKPGFSGSVWSNVSRRYWNTKRGKPISYYS